MGIVSSRAQVPLSDAPVTSASNCSPILDSSSIAAADLLDLTLDLIGGILGFGEVLCQQVVLLVTVWRRLGPRWRPSTVAA